MSKDAKKIRRILVVGSSSASSGITNPHRRVAASDIDFRFRPTATPVHALVRRRLEDRCSVWFGGDSQIGAAFGSADLVALDLSDAMSLFSRVLGRAIASTLFRSD